MKKAILICIVCLAGAKAFSQTAQTFTEEKSSEWVAVVLPKPRPVHVRSKPVRKQPVAITHQQMPASQPAAEPKPIDVFSKTNSQVKRFKKEKNK